MAKHRDLDHHLDRKREELRRWQAELESEEQKLLIWRRERRREEKHRRDSKFPTSCVTISDHRGRERRYDVSEDDFHDKRSRASMNRRSDRDRSRARTSSRSRSYRDRDSRCRSRRSHDQHHSRYRHRSTLSHYKDTLERSRFHKKDEVNHRITQRHNSSSKPTSYRNRSNSRSSKSSSSHRFGRYHKSPQTSDVSDPHYTRSRDGLSTKFPNQHCSYGRSSRSSKSAPPHRSSSPSSGYTTTVSNVSLEESCKGVVHCQADGIGIAEAKVT